ncbi:hypothetical protein V496_00582 [Pseudogymnoascus sp. VKM F-4515 (FW-2607)]|nr:hypothetical protein V496_00582 [Pseudogymnoascus sp. VKM F-4515 (FW-2607)]KFZ00152.1 hypothetical protein V498_00259 [Pseudogymnoascus sp. VKM F-4517 (FW-2822)]
MSDGQEDKTDAPQGYKNNEAAYKSESESDNGNDDNAVARGKANNQGQNSNSLYQARAQRQLKQAAPNGNAAQLSRDEAREKMGYRAAAIRESRIKDRPVNKKASDSALKIKIELDLEVEVDLYARVKGDVTIGLM